MRALVSVRAVASTFVVLAGCTATVVEDRATVAERTGWVLAACLPGSGWSNIEYLEQELHLRGALQFALGTELDDARLACIRDAGGDCEAVRGCLGVSYRRVADCSAPPTCDGDRARVCSMLAVGVAEETTLDCAAYGMICAEAPDRGIGPGCVVEACGAQYFACESETRFNSCSGAGRYVGTCLPGTRCDEAAGTCVGAGATCDHNRCEGEVFVECDSITYREGIRIDCAALGRRCITYASLNDAGCGPVFEECATGVPSSCEGDAVRYCGDDGLWQTFDCLAAGFTGCTSGECVPTVP